MSHHVTVTDSDSDMMVVPVFLAACHRLLLLLLFSFVLALFVPSYVRVVQGIIVYDLQTLLNI